MKHVSVTGQARRHQPGYTLFCLFVGALLALLAPARGVAQITWTNYSSPVLGPAPGWESSWVNFVSVIYQDSQYVMWYSGATNTNGASASVGRATSPDGLTWTKDALNPVLQHGSSAWDSKAAWVPKVLKIGNAYTMWFTGSTSSDVWQIGRATSSDGRVWVQDTTNPVIRVGAPGKWDGALVHTGSVLFDGTTYRMWYTGMSQGYGAGSSGIGLATSADGIHWVKDTLDNPVLAAGPSGAWDQHGVGECSVVYDSASQRYLMFYDGNEQDYFTAGTSGIGYASSADGIHWIKYADNPVLPNNQAGLWTSQPSSPFVVLRDSTFHMWYGGTNVNSLGYATAHRVSSMPTAGLQLWLRADAGVDTLNGTVSRWHDQSGNGNDALQTDAARQPALVVAPGANDMPVLQFDGVNDRLGLTGTKPMHQISMFLVFKIDSGATSVPSDQFGVHPYYPIQLGDTYIEGQIYGLSMRNDFNGNSPNIIDPFTGGASWVHATLTGIASFGDWKVLSVTTDKVMFNTTLRVGGQEAVISPQTNTNMAIAVPLGSADGRGVGGVGGGDRLAPSFGSSIFKGDIAEVMVYDTVLTEADRHGVEQYLSTRYNIPMPSTAVQNGTPIVPIRFALEQNYPNPFNPTTVVSFQLPEASNVRLVVYDILGREVSVLVNERKAAGSYSVSFDAHGMASGMYLYRLQAGNFVQTRKLLLLK